MKLTAMAGLIQTMFILLIGPKGSGKSHVGRLLERTFDVRFLHVETLWIAYRNWCDREHVEPSISGGIHFVVPTILRALQDCSSVCVETTGASPEILAALLGLVPRSEIAVVRLYAPVELCIARVQGRDASDHLPTDAEMVRRVHEISVSIEIEADLELDTSLLSDVAIVERFRTTLIDPNRSSP